jgi:hypothetical protein
VGRKEGEVTQTMYTHVSKCKNNLKKRKKEMMVEKLLKFGKRGISRRMKLTGL